MAQEALCPFCGDIEYVGLAEIWEDGAFQIECCCDAMYDTAVNEMADDPAWARTLLKRAGIEELTGHRLRRVADNETGSLILDYQLELHPVSFSVGRAFVSRHHVHCSAPVIIWTTCISTGAPGSAGVPCGQMERSNGKIWDPIRGRHRRISRRGG